MDTTTIVGYLESSTINSTSTVGGTGRMGTLMMHNTYNGKKTQMQQGLVLIYHGTGRKVSMMAGVKQAGRKRTPGTGAG